VTYDVLLRSSGVVAGESDLWCTYAAVRTLKWLDRLSDLDSPEAVAGFLGARRNPDGGYAWSAGMSSDAWATYYCTQAMRDLRQTGGSSANRPGASWVWSVHNDDGGFAMTPGQASDVWATYYAVCTLVEIYGQRPPATLRGWMSRLQADDGGLCWSPAHAKSGRSDVRACYYAITAWSTASSAGDGLPWDRERLTAWLKGRQSGAGGFTFAHGDDTDCLWAAFRATSALSRLGERPADRDGCVAWVRGRLQPGESFTRWPGYPVQDVWAAFCAVGTLIHLGDDVGDIADQVAAALLSFRSPGSGFTYRTPELASDVLTTSAHVLSGLPSETQAGKLIRWLEGCMLPNEDGIMYMPGRGSEVRCTLWALCAGAFAGDSPALMRIANWLIGAIQNPDGGLGYWEGRGSDMVSTCAGAEILSLTGGDPAVWAAGIAAFVSSCHVAPGQYANVPGGRPTLRATLQALRTLRRVGDADAVPVSHALARHRVRGGGFANEGSRLPDLLSTYEATLTADMFGLDVDLGHIARFLDSVRAGGGGFAWTPLMKVSGGPLADCLGRRLEMRLSTRRPALPPLTIS
jgi:hypothetical protein